MFIFKKIAAVLLMPLGFSLIVLMIGWFLLFFRRRLREAKVLILIGVIVLVIPSIGPISNMLTTPLESRYPTLDSNNLPREIGCVVVLGGGLAGDDQDSARVCLSRASLARLVEGIRIQRMYRGSKLVLSGGKVFAQVSESEVMADQARSLGVNGDDIILENNSPDTETQARLIKPFVKDRNFVLVTSAIHMPRSIGLFRNEGMEPIAAPTDYLPKGGADPRRYLPQTAALGKSAEALNEYLGMAWSKVRGKL
jgi:uncharacterized SAM-binding protein YcdF (DUF218 family)